MPAYGERQEAVIDAPPEACYDALADTERLHEWQDVLRRATVRERDDAGRATVVEFEVDIMRLRTVRYTIRQVHDRPHRLASEYLGGDFRDFAGEWRFAPESGGRTRATLDLRIDPGRFVPGALRNRIAEAVVSRALEDLRRRVAG